MNIPTVEHDPNEIQHEPEQASGEDINSWNGNLYKNKTRYGTEKTWTEQLISEQTAREHVASNRSSQETPPLPVPQHNYDWNIQLQTFDYKNIHYTSGMQSPMQRMTTLTQSVYKIDLRIANESTQSQHINLDTDAYPYFQTSLFYHPKLKNGHMHDSFVNYLQFIFSISKVPPKLKLYLELGEMYILHLLVNDFWGSFTAPA